METLHEIEELSNDFINGFIIYIPNKSFYLNINNNIYINKNYTNDEKKEISDILDNINNYNVIYECIDDKKTIKFIKKDDNTIKSFDLPFDIYIFILKLTLLKNY